MTKCRSSPGISRMSTQKCLWIPLIDHGVLALAHGQVSTHKDGLSLLSFLYKVEIKQLLVLKSFSSKNPLSQSLLSITCCEVRSHEYSLNSRPHQGLLNVPLLHYFNSEHVDLAELCEPMGLIWHISNLNNETLMSLGMLLVFWLGWIKRLELPFALQSHQFINVLTVSWCLYDLPIFFWISIGSHLAYSWVITTSQVIRSYLLYHN